MPIQNKSQKEIESTTKSESETISDVAFDDANEISEESDGKGRRYYEAVGRRKRAVARARLFTKGEKEFLVNGVLFDKYFATEELQNSASSALNKMKVVDKFRVSVMVRGGGANGQSEAVRHSIARALLKFNADFRKRLKRAGFLKRDPREKERRKFGLRKARRAPQWSKR
jgi:small subunit ribosomal protein S9